jgi:holo-[acyl-carrier protein] synthase
MIVGIGNDILEIQRIQESIEKLGHRFLDRLFTKKEQEYCNQFERSVPHFAGRFSAKEAIAKALGTGFGAKLSWLDIEILNDSSGRPFVQCSEAMNQQFNHPQIFISISHCRNYATAFAVYTGSS